MKKINFKCLLFIILFVNISLIASFEKNFANDTKPKYIYGKVVYADDRSPVSDGFIKVFIISDESKEGRILESTTIEPNGEFKLLVPPELILDERELMAYPNDLDVGGKSFEPKVINAGRIFSNPKNENLLTIEVNRIEDKLNKSGGSRKSTDMNNKLLLQNYPNPFNPTTLIRFELPQSSNVTLKVYNMSGEVISTLVENKNLRKGFNEFEFDASSLSSGIYIYSLTSGNYIETKKMMLLK
ncbi:MAG: T9SS type A sorting domain-containing protein [Bacteroidota bacterium]|nr:T9SS type A sorting domain-containing protein [Bacteroidota bacterium]